MPVTCISAMYVVYELTEELSVRYVLLLINYLNLQACNLRGVLKILFV